MKNYIVGIFSIFEGSLHLFKVTAENEYEAVKIGMMRLAIMTESEQYEEEWQKSEEYPKDIEGLHIAYVEIAFSVIEVSAF